MSTASTQMAPVEDTDELWMRVGFFNRNPDLHHLVGFFVDALSCRETDLSLISCCHLQIVEPVWCRGRMPNDCPLSGSWSRI